jgi:hypothetical protein
VPLSHATRNIAHSHQSKHHCLTFGHVRADFLCNYPDPASQSEQNLVDTRADQPRPTAGSGDNNWAMGCITFCLLLAAYCIASPIFHLTKSTSISCQMVPNSHADSQWYLSPGPEICLLSLPHSGLFNIVSLCNAATAPCTHWLMPST